MSRINEIYEQMSWCTEHVQEVIEKKKAEGQKIVGVLPIYAPEELVHAAGMFPVGCWGGTTSISKAAKYFPAFACSIMQAVMEYAESGAYANLDGFLVSTPCDTLKCVTQDLLSACPGKPVICISYPQNNKPDFSVRYTMTELYKVKAKLEALCGHPIADAAIKHSIEIYNANRTAMQEFYRITAANPGVVSARSRHIVAKSSYFMTKEEHTALVSELNGLLQGEPAANWTGKKVVLAGIVAEPCEMLDILDEMKMAVVADELAHENRQFRTLVPQGIDQIERLARQYQKVEACSVVYDPQKKRCQRIADMAAQTKADGVIYCQMKFCDPEEFDYPFVKQACDAAGIPLLNLEVDQLAETAGQARTRIQAFAEMLG